MTYATYADVLRPAHRRHALTYDLYLVLGGSLLIALCAQLSVRIPFSPIPITAQTLGVLLVGALLGSKRGGLAMLAYLTEGAAGLPVFAGGGAGIATLVGPTGGYLFGFVAAAYITGMLAERGWDRHVATVIPAMVLGTLAIYAFGLAWLAIFIGGENLLPMGLYPFLPGAVIKIALAAFLLPSGWKLLGLKRKQDGQK